MRGSAASTPHGPPRAAHAVSDAGSAAALTAAVGLMLAALLLGGGTHNHLFSDLIVQALASVILVLQFRRFRWLDHAPPERGLLLMCLAALAIPLLHSVPMPGALWELAPGRSALATEGRLAQLGMPSWRPWSLDGNASLAAARALLPAIALAWVCLRVGEQGLRWLALLVVAAAMLMVPIGLAQVLVGPDSPLRPYQPTNVLDAVGLFANRNHYAALLACALALCYAGLISEAQVRRGSHGWVRMAAWLAAAAVLLSGTVLSRSRGGLLLVVFFSLFMLGVAWLQRREAPRAWRWLGVFLLLGGLFAFQIGFVAIADRLASIGDGDHRFTVIAAVLESGAQYGWLGTGVGSFPAVYAAYEPVEILGAKVLNHAHNDWAELWVELGVLLIPMVLMAAAFLWIWARQVLIRADLRRDRLQPYRLAALAIVLGLALHSLFDYPLRTTAMSCVMAFACAWLARAAAKPLPEPIAVPEVEALPERPQRVSLRLVSGGSDSRRGES